MSVLKHLTGSELSVLGTSTQNISPSSLLLLYYFTKHIMTLGEKGYG
jgi:hypothetical protein